MEIYQSALPSHFQKLSTEKVSFAFLRPANKSVTSLQLDRRGRSLQKLDYGKLRGSIQEYLRQLIWCIFLLLQTSIACNIGLALLKSQFPCWYRHGQPPCLTRATIRMQYAPKSPCPGYLILRLALNVRQLLETSALLCSQQRPGLPFFVVLVAPSIDEIRIINFVYDLS